MGFFDKNKLNLLTSPFRYGHWIDSTIFCLLLSVLVFALAATYFVHSPSTPYRGERRALLQNAELLTDSLKVSRTLQRGDSVDVLGWVDSYDYDRMLFWVETSRGERGFLDAMAISDSAVVQYTGINFSKKYHYTARHHGDTVILKKMIQDGHLRKFEIHNPKGTDTTLVSSAMKSLLSMKMGLERKINFNGNDLRSMSEEKFRELYLGRSLAECDSVYLPAIFRAQGRDSLRAIYPVRVFREGKFYRPIVSFSADSVAVAYTIPERAQSNVNSWILRYLPFYKYVCDLPFIWPTRTDGLYAHDGSWYDRMTYSLYVTSLNGISWSSVGPMLLFVLSLVFLLLRMFFTPLILPLILFGLLRFPLVFQGFSNKVMYGMLTSMAAVLCIVWWFCTLSTNYAIPCAICQSLAYIIYVGIITGLLTDHKPESRCSGCKTLYSCKFDRKEKYGEPTFATEEVTHVIDTVVTNVEHYTTYDEVTVTTTDGYGHKSTSTHKENVKNHSVEHGYNIVGRYKENVKYQYFRSYWICQECGHDEVELDRERYVLDSVLLEKYKSHF